MQNTLLKNLFSKVCFPFHVSITAINLTKADASHTYTKLICSNDLFACGIIPNTEVVGQLLTNYRQMVKQSNVFTMKYIEI